MYRRGLALLVVAHLASAANGGEPALTQLRHDVWTIESGLPQDSINGIAQSRDGYLWIGTISGLSRFDGVRFVTFDKHTTPALPSNLTSAVLAARDGSVWIGTEDAGIVRLDGKTVRRYTVREGLFSNTIFSLFEDRAGAIWAGTQHGGLNRIAGGKIATFAGNEGLPPHGISSIEEDADGALWIGTFGGGLVRMEKGKVVRTYTMQDGLPRDSVRTLHRDRRGVLWIGTSGGGLCALDQGKFIIHSSARGLSNDVVRVIVEDDRGDLWIGTDDGLNRWSGGRFETYLAGDGLSNNVVTSIHQDREGSMWIGTQGGLNRFCRGALTTLTTREGLSNDVVRSIWGDANGVMWIGTFRGLNRIEQGMVTRFTKADGLASDVVTAVYGDRAGNLWIGMRNAGLARYRDGRFTNYSVPDGLAYDAVRAIFEDRGGTLWIGTDGGGISLLRDGKFTSLTTGDGLPSNFIRAFYEARDGAMWIATEGGGVACHRNGRFAAVPARERLPSSAIMSIAEDGDGSLWLGTYGGGLVRLAGGAIASFGTQHGLLDDIVFDVVEDAAGDFWMTSPKGVARVSGRELRELAAGRIPRVHATVYGTRDGMKSSKCNGGSQPSAWQAADGRIWIPTSRGVAIVDPAHIRTNTLPPPVKIETVVANGREAAGDIGPGVKRLQIHYTALSFLVPERVRFRYRLEGDDGDWIDAGDQRVAYFTNVRPGSYRFRVLAMNNDGVWNDAGASIALRVRPFFYQTPAFLFLSIAAALVLIAVFVRLRMRGARRREQDLVALVEARTKELQESVRDLARSNEELVQANRLKLDLLSIAAHDLRNPLQAISGFAQILVEQNGEESGTGKKAVVICRASEEMLRLIGDLIESVRIESGEIEIELVVVDMSALAVEVASTYRDAAARKQQSLVIDAPQGCYVRADQRRLSEAIENLVSNAIKYSPKKESITIDVRAVGTEARLEIRDQGPGLTAEDMKRLFGRFQRLSARPTGGESSTGLGLSIARRFVELQGGRIWAESEPGHGSTFTIAMPLIPSVSEGPGAREGA